MSVMEALGWGAGEESMEPRPINFTLVYASSSNVVISFPFRVPKGNGDDGANVRVATNAS